MLASFCCISNYSLKGEEILLGKNLSFLSKLQIDAQASWLSFSQVVEGWLNNFCCFALIRFKYNPLLLEWCLSLPALPYRPLASNFNGKTSAIYIDTVNCCLPCSSSSRPASLGVRAGQAREGN